MKILLTGSYGQAGRALQATRPPWAELLCTDADTLDICDRSAVCGFVADSPPDVIVNAAAYTDVERAETETKLAHAINARGADNLALAARQVGARLVQISTDYVFNSDRAVPIRPDHTCSPANAYGASKRDGELRVLERLGGEALILRTSWLYYESGNNFVETMLRLMADRDIVRVVADQFAAPTWAATLANAIWSGIRLGIGGVHHWRDAGIASWYDFAIAVGELGLATGRLTRSPDIVPITTDEYPTKARRPIFSLLDTGDTEDVLEISTRHWRLELTDMMEQARNA